MNAEQFWANLDKQKDGCWVWTRAKTNGYGMVNYQGFTLPAHRLAWMLARGAIGDRGGYHGTVVAHKCDNRACCNPDHLFLTNQAGNLVDAVIKGRSSAQKLTQHQVLEIIDAIKAGDSRNEIAERYGVTSGAIHSIAKKRTWKHLTKGIVDLRFGPREAHPEKHRTADYARIVLLLNSGKSHRQIAKECGTTHPTVARVARYARLGVNTPFKRMNEMDRERIRDLARSGVGQREIANWLHISQASVSRTLAMGG